MLYKIIVLVFDEDVFLTHIRVTNSHPRYKRGRVKNKKAATNNLQRLSFYKFSLKYCSIFR